MNKDRNTRILNILSALATIGSQVIFISFAAAFDNKIKAGISLKVKIFRKSYKVGNHVSVSA